MHVFTYKELAFFHECIVRYKARNEYVHLTSDEVNTLNDKLLSDLGTSEPQLALGYTFGRTPECSLESANLDDDLTCVGDKPGKGEVDSLYLDQILAQLAHLCERLTEELPYAESVNVNAVSRATILSHMIDDYLGGA